MDLCYVGHNGAADAPRGDLPWRLASQYRGGSQVPNSEVPEVAKDVFSSHSEQAVLYSSAEIFPDTLACLMFPF